MRKSSVFASLIALLFLALPAQADDTVINATGIVQDTDSSAVDLSGETVKAFAIQAQVTNTTPSAQVFASSTDIDHTTGKFTKTAHGLVTGLVGQFTTSSALPSGLSTSTNYYVIVVDANTLEFATSLTNALAGTALSISGNGTGNQTFTPTSLSAAIKTQHSVDCQNWVDIGSSSQSFTATGTLLFSGVDDPFDCVRAVWTHTSGMATAVVRYRVKSYGAAK